MQKIITSLQTSKSLNAIKNAVNQSGFYQLGIAFIIFTFTLTEKYFTIPETVNFFVYLAYIVSLLYLSVLLSRNVIKAMFDDEISEHLLHFSSYLVLVFALPFLNQMQFFSLFPFFSLWLAWGLSWLAKVAQKCQVKNQNRPLAVDNFYNQTLPIIALILLVLIPFGIYMKIFPALITLHFKILYLLSRFPVLFIVLMITLYFWYKGLHGVAVVANVMRPFWFSMLLYNGQAVMMGEVPAYISTEAFISQFVWLGGSGGTLGLAIAMRYFAQSKELKQLGEDVFNPSIHNINENVIFGTPIVDNPYFKWPFFLSPIITMSIAYYAISMNWIPNLVIPSPWVLPIPIGVFFSSLGSIKAVFFSTILIVLSFLIYYPFFKAYDRSLLEKEVKECE